MDRSAVRGLRQRVQPVFQNPCSTFNPRFSIGASIALGFNLLGNVEKAAIPGKVAWLLEDVGLDPDLARALPHQRSGGQRQRAAIARAAGGATGSPAPRRAHLGPRRLRSGAGAQPFQGSSAPLRLLADARHPRPARRHLHVRQRARHEIRPRSSNAARPGRSSATPSRSTPASWFPPRRSGRRRVRPREREGPAGARESRPWTLCTGTVSRPRRWYPDCPGCFCRGYRKTEATCQCRAFST